MAIAQSLATFSIAAAGTQDSSWVAGFGDATALLFQVRFAYGGGGTAAKFYIQTTIDENTTPVDIICSTFTTAGAVKLYNLSALTPKTTAVVPTNGTLTDDTCVDGIICDRLRVKLISTGTYTTSTAAYVIVQKH